MVPHYNPALTDPLGLYYGPCGTDDGGHPIWVCPDPISVGGGIDWLFDNTGIDWVSEPVFAGGKGGGGGGPANNDINKTWSKTFPCNKSATQVMSAVQNDMGQFADNRNTLFAANFPNQPLTMGGQYAIQPGLNPHSGDGSIFPTGTLAVTVTSQSANGWTFTTDPSQHYIDGTVSFSSTNAGSGNITFSITANGNYSNLFWAAFGPVIKAGENSTWSNMLGNVQGYCGSPIGQ